MSSANKHGYCCRKERNLYERSRQQSWYWAPRNAQVLPRRMNVRREYRKQHD